MAELNGNLKELADRLNNAQSVILTTHSGPDGDGLGCVAALGQALEAQGKRVLCVLPDPLPDRYRFLDPQRRFRPFHDLDPSERDGSWDFALVIDTHQWALLRDVATWLQNAPMPTAFLDHHPMDEERDDVYGSIDAVAAGMLVYEILTRHLAWPITPEIAEAIYISLSFDTNSFKYLRSQSQPLDVAAALVEAGVDTTRVYRNLFASNPLRKARILGWVLSKMTFECEGRLGWVAIPFDQIDQLQAERDDLRDCITHILEIEGVEVAACLKEVAPGEVKISLRSKGTYPINGIAMWMNGGGHTLAAGCEHDGTLDDAWNTLAPALRDLLSDRLDLEALTAGRR